MPGKRINSDWYTLNRIVRELVREIDRPEGVEWTNVYILSQDLLNLSRQAMVKIEPDNPFSQS